MENKHYVIQQRFRDWEQWYTLPPRVAATRAGGASGSTLAGTAGGSRFESGPALQRRRAAP